MPEVWKGWGVENMRVDGCGSPYALQVYPQSFHRNEAAACEIDLKSRFGWDERNCRDLRKRRLMPMKNENEQ